MGFSNEGDDFFTVDLSKYNDPWDTIGPSTCDDDSASLAAGTSSLPAAESSSESEKDVFIPSSWRTPGFEMEVERQVVKLFIVEAAQHRKREIQDGRIELPPIHLGHNFLDQPDNPARYVIHDLWPVGGNVLFAAPAKFGKSSVMMNLVRSFLDGAPFLDFFGVEQLGEDEGLLLIDMEMSEDRVRAEIRQQGILSPNRLHVATLRGEAAKLDIYNPRTRQLWVSYCRDHNIKRLIIDPLAPLFGHLAVEENDNTAVNKFFQQLDEVKKNAGIRDLLVTHHSGHTADWRPRGASRFNDWPDALWVAKIDGDVTDPTSPRKFFARGRDVGEDFRGPGILVRDVATRRLSFTAGTPTVNGHEQIVLNVVYSNQGLKITDLFPLCRQAGVAEIDGVIRGIIHGLGRRGDLHEHVVGSSHYWFSDQSSCTYCALAQGGD
jgi:hypothetical protein